MADIAWVQLTAIWRIVLTLDASDYCQDIMKQQKQEVAISLASYCPTAKGASEGQQQKEEQYSPRHKNAMFSA